MIGGESPFDAVATISSNKNVQFVDDVASYWYTQRKTPRNYETTEKALDTTG